jgi:hypothetical protein
MSRLTVDFSDALGKKRSAQLRRLTAGCYRLKQVHEIGALERRLRTLHFDQALVTDDWRVEYLYLEKGYPHWRLYRRFQLIGSVILHADSKTLSSSLTIEKTRYQFATYLTGLGLHADDWRQTNAITRLDARRSNKRLF